MVRRVRVREQECDLRDAFDAGAVGAKAIHDEDGRSPELPYF